MAVVTLNYLHGQPVSLHLVLWTVRLASSLGGWLCGDARGMRGVFRSVQIPVKVAQEAFCSGLVSKAAGYKCSAAM
jgi:hypothetical protein